MAEPTDMLAREIDEELRRERLLRLWDQYGTYIIAAAVALVVGVGGYKLYENRLAQANEEASTRYILALRDLALNKAADGQKSLESLVANAPSGYAMLSRLRLAEYDQKTAQKSQAIATYEDIAKDSGVDPILADYARLQMATLKLDSADFTQLKNQLTPLSDDKSAWRFEARELLGLAAYRSGRLAEARNHYQRLATDRTAPTGVAERARTMLAVLAETDEAGPSAATEKPDPSARAEPGQNNAEPSKSPGKAN